MSDVSAGYALLQASYDDYALAHDFYTGARAEQFASPTLRRILRKTGEKYRVNVIKAVVDSVADGLELLSVTCPDDAANKTLQAIREENGLLLEEQSFTRKASEFGDYYGLVWDDEDNPSGVIITGISPTSGRMVYDVDNPRKKRYFFHAWTVKLEGGEEVTRAQLLYEDRIERWETRPGSKPEHPESWVPRNRREEGEEVEDSAVEVNPYGVVPVFHFRNDSPFGVPEHLEGYGAQDALNKIVVSHLSTIDYHIAPQRWAITLPGNVDDDLDLDDDYDVDGDDSDTPATSDGKGLASGPGVMQYLENVKEVGQFDPASMAPFLDSARFYVGVMAQTTATPMDQLDPSGDEPSGESRRRKDRARTSKVKDRQKRYRSTWADLYAFALQVAGYSDRIVEVTYAPAEVVTDAEGWAIAKSKMEAGVPPRQALIETGYPEQLVDEWFPEGEENGRLRVADLEAVARILKDIGTAVALNIITPEEGRAMLPEGVIPDGTGTAPTA